MTWWIVLLLIAAVMVLLAMSRKVGILGWMGIWWVASYLALSYGIPVPLPASIIGMFMSIITIALLAFMSSNSKYRTAVSTSIVSFTTDQKYTVPLAIVLVLIPVLVAFKIYTDMNKAPEPPVFGRTIHPPSPQTISFQGKTIDIVNGDNPYRELETTDPEAFQAHLENGRRVYYQNCVYCHGDDMAGKGMFAHALDPLPANFQDPTTIASFRETFIFWRVAKGGPGLPDEATPWLSAMPAWEKFLTEEEIWDVILFMYDFTGQRPRAKEELH